jgi:hypothetical protein
MRTTIEIHEELVQGEQGLAEATRLVHAGIVQGDYRTVVDEANRACWYIGYLRILTRMTSINPPTFKELDAHPRVLGDRWHDGDVYTCSGEMAELRGEVAACRWVTYPNREEPR